MATFWRSFWAVGCLQPKQRQIFLFGSFLSMSLGIYDRSVKLPLCFRVLNLSIFISTSFLKLPSFQYLSYRSMFILYIYYRMSGIYKNRLAKLDNNYRFDKHISHLQQIATTQQKDYFQKSYRKILVENGKRKQLDGRRRSEIDFENKILLEKITKIKVSPKSKQYWLKDRSHSLNQIVRKKSMQSIGEENVKMLQRILTQKPYIDSQNIMKKSVEQIRRADNISMLEKYRLPEVQDKRYAMFGKRSISSFDNYPNPESQRYKKVSMNFSLKDDWKNFPPYREQPTKQSHSNIQENVKQQN